jgi:hypothetical protein
MSIASILKRLTQALPAILAAAPGIVDAARQVRQALKKPKKPAGSAAVRSSDSPEAPRRLSADSEPGAR